MANQVSEKLNNLIKERGLTVEGLKEILTQVNDPWERARGILKNKKVDVLKYQKKMRRELER